MLRKKGFDLSSETMIVILIVCVLAVVILVYLFWPVLKALVASPGSLS